MGKLYTKNENILTNWEADWKNEGYFCTSRAASSFAAETEYINFKHLLVCYLQCYEFILSFCITHWHQLSLYFIINVIFSAKYWVSEFSNFVVLSCFYMTCMLLHLIIFQMARDTFTWHEKDYISQNILLKNIKSSQKIFILLDNIKYFPLTSLQIWIIGISLTLLKFKFIKMNYHMLLYPVRHKKEIHVFCKTVLIWSPLYLYFIPC
jgi:hypothetical protein